MGHEDVREFEEDYGGLGGDLNMGADAGDCVDYFFAVLLAELELEAGYQAGEEFVVGGYWQGFLAVEGIYVVDYC